ncbi:hypothetical protein C6P40_000453 [Pichia californica]|uniref:VanZ-like domain-containing protein n=1 Tax=Pichia californica TaxID=460514 RepID=A0A9P6WPZ3_9ASCO|nr:hypothetical protein C6P42_001845 [[Candida] californica]KAG0690955.1 hypothetical protein C6P40_000453 [[Candida] californica]
MYLIFNAFKIRKNVLLIFILLSVLAVYLGFADISLPHDKYIHFIMFFIMSFLFYWILDSKYTWTIRNLTFLICTIIGGIGSEYLQHYISPFRTFDYYDIIVNVLGSISAIIISDIYRYFYIKPNNEHDIELGII